MSINTEFIDDNDFLELDRVLSQAEASRKPIATNTPPKDPNATSLVTSPISTTNFPSTQTTSPNKQQLLHQKINQTTTSVPVVLPANTSVPQTLNVPFTVDIQVENKERFSATTPLQEPVLQVYRSICGQSYDNEAKKWTFPLSQYRNFVYRLKSIKGVNVKEFPGAIINTFIDKKNIRNDNVALDKLPTSLLDSLFPYQKSGVIFGIQKGGRVLIADEMGLGKTIQAIAIALYYRNEWPCLIIVPSSVRLQWADQFEKWASDISQDDINVVMNGKGTCNKLVNIISYDLVTRLQEDISSRKFQVVIADESHLLKTWNTKRTTCIRPLIEGSRRAILLSGTPALSRPKELYTQVSALYPNLLPRFHEFGIRYCGGYYNKFSWNYDGASNLNELHLLLENTVMIRRLKATVLNELPEKQRFQVTISVEKKHMKILTRVNKELKEARKKYFNANNKADSKDPGVEKRRLILELYSDLGASKLHAINQYIKDIIEGEETSTKYLIFGHHLSVLDGICATLKAAISKADKPFEYVRIDGKTPSHQRYDFANLFQTDPNCKFAVLSMTAAGVGLNLTAANVVIFTELFWNPGTLKQCEDRAHRIGQTKGVEIRYLTAKGTMDDVLWKMIERKLSIIGETLNGEEDKIDASLKQFESKGPIDSYLEEFLEQLESFSERNTEIKERKERRKKRQSLGISADQDKDEDEEEVMEDSKKEEEDEEEVKPKKRKSNPIILEDSEEEEEETFKFPSKKSGIIEVEDEFEESQEFTKEQAEEKEKLAFSKFSQFTYNKPLNF